MQPILNFGAPELGPNPEDTGYFICIRFNLHFTRIFHAEHNNILEKTNSSINPLKSI